MAAGHFTYDSAKFNDTTTAAYYPGATTGARYQIRLLLQDTNPARQLFSDEEIDWQQTQEMNPWMTAAALSDILVARAGAVRNKRIGELSITYDPHFYRLLSANLRARGMNYQIPYAGGISIGDKLAQQGDTDWVTPKIARGIDDNPSAPQPDTPASNPLETI